MMMSIVIFLLPQKTYCRLYEDIVMVIQLLKILTCSRAFLPLVSLFWLWLSLFCIIFCCLVRSLVIVVLIFTGIGMI